MTVLESHWILEDSEFGLSEEQFLWAELTDMGGKKLQCFWKTPTSGGFTSQYIKQNVYSHIAIFGISVSEVWSIDSRDLF